MSVLTEHLDYSMAEGMGTRARECDRCVGQGNSMAVQITRKADGFLAYCFRCSKSYFFPDENASEKQVKQIMESSAKKTHVNRPDVVTLPDDYTTELPPKAAVQLYNLEIMPDEIEKYDIGWCPSRERIVVPVYQYRYSATHGLAKKLVGIMGRKLSDDTTDKPKWWSQRQADIKHPRYFAPAKAPTDRSKIVVVENCFSAIKVAEATGWASIALLTSYLPYELYGPLCKYNEVHLWLDADAYGKACQYQAKLGNRGVTAHTHVTYDPPKPKDCTPAQIRSELGVDS